MCKAVAVARRPEVGILATVERPQGHPIGIVVGGDGGERLGVTQRRVAEVRRLAGLRAGNPVEAAVAHVAAEGQLGVALPVRQDRAGDAAVGAEKDSALREVVGPVAQEAARHPRPGGRARVRANADLGRVEDEEAGPCAGGEPGEVVVG